MRRPTLYDPLWEKPVPLVPCRRRPELDHRITARGDVECSAGAAQIASIAADLRRQGVKSVALCLLNSYVNPAEERRIAGQLSKLLIGIYVSASLDVLPRSGSTSG
jgi:N-methylhydantoinase A